MDDYKKQFSEALQSLMLISEKAQQRDLWKYKDIGDNLDSFLTSLTKGHLELIKRTLSIPIKSNLRKEEFMQGVKQHLYLYLRPYLYQLNLKHYKYITQIIKNGGIIPYSPNEKRLVIQLRNSGIAFPVIKEDEQVVIMPSETITFFNQLDNHHLKEVLEYNTEIIQITNGLVFYYGTISYDALWKTMNSYHLIENMKYHQFVEIIKIDIFYNKRIYDSRGYLYLSNTNSDKLLNLRSQNKSTYLDYYPINKLKAIKASDPHYFDKTPEVAQLMDYLAYKYTISSEELMIIIRKFTFEIKSGLSFNKYMEFLNKYFEFPSYESTQEILGILQRLHNNTKMWTLKGHTPIEASKHNMINLEIPSILIPLQNQNSNTNIKRKKVGRNDPCPCGSGRKYKKCCLGND